jgi:alpha-N-arabinofuranosidase
MGADAAWTTTVTVKPNTFYRLSGWIKTQDVRGAVGALLNIQNVQEVKTAALSGIRDWTQVSTVFQSGAATELEINCLFGGWGKATGQAWYDDVALQQVDEPPMDTRATVTIDTGARSIPYSPMIFGGFLEHFDHQIYGGVFEPGSPLSDQNGFRKDVIAALRELKVPVVRWPGGCYASGYHWERGVGKTRQPTDDMAWGVVEPNTFGTDEYVKLCRRLGWQPYICNNAGNGTVEEMRNWVEYCNGKEGKYAQMRQANGQGKPWNVNIWSVGNENWGAHEIGYKPIEQWAPLVLEAAKAMKAADPRIQLTAAALPTREWTLPLLKLAGPYLDYISIHSYWLPLWGKNDMPDYLTCIMNSEAPEQLIADYVGVLEESGYRGRIKIAFDEWNLRGWHHEGFPRKAVQDYSDPEVVRLIAAREKNDIASQYSMADALFSASFFNACLRHAADVGMANIAPLVNTRGPLYVHPKGIVKRTHFHAMAMYANELEARVGKLNLEAGSLRQGNRTIPVMDAIATVDESGHQWSIALVNRHPVQSLACTIQMKDRILDGNYEALVLTGDSPDAYNDIGHPDRVVPAKRKLTFTRGAVILPPHSLTIVKVTPARAAKGAPAAAPLKPSN